MALDVSGSVDSREYRLQLDGLASALLDEEVKAALLGIPDYPVVLSAFEWSGKGSQRVLFDWRPVRNESDLTALAALLHNTRRSEMSVSTGLGTAILFASARFETAPTCLRQVLDVSGDGKNNDGPRPQDVDSALLPGMNINALVIGPDTPAAVGAQAREMSELVAYFQAYVLRGPDAFVEVAAGYNDYSKAMQRKLLKELKVLTLSDAGPNLAERPR